MNKERIYQIIKKKGKKLTKVRKEIIDMFVSAHVVLSPVQIQEVLSEKGIKVNKTTVYRELEFLHSNSFLKAIYIDTNCVYYESALHPHHHHVICRECKKIDMITTEELDGGMENLRKKIKKKGYSHLDHSIEFFGLCDVCDTKITSL